MTRSRTVWGLLGCVLFGLASPVAVADWKHYEAKSYGFSMLIPQDATLRTKESGGGWGSMYAESEGVRLHGLAKLGARESDGEIEKFAVRTIGIPMGEWKMIDSGSGRGWERYKTFEAVRGNKLYFGGYGVSPRGNYLLYLETTPSDYNDHKADYIKWYESIRLD